MKKIIVILIFVYLVLAGCAGGRMFTYNGTIVPGKWLDDLEVPCTREGCKQKVKIQVYFPKDYKRGDNSRVLIALPEYDGTMSDWRVNTAIESYADSYEMVIVSPDIRRCVYATEYFPETRVRWGEISAPAWLGEELLPFLQKTFAIAGDREKTGIFGFGMGARGAFMTAAMYPRLFIAVGGLAGYYDKQSVIRNRSFTAVYGKYQDFKDRWKEKDNLITMVKSMTDFNVFIAHGNKDPFSPIGQSRLIAIRFKQLDRRKGDITMQYVEKKYKVHDWEFCRASLNQMMYFFDESLEKER
ncbi:MAG: alpha/beta hydrolase [Spirochaetota bacterium]